MCVDHMTVLDSSNIQVLMQMGDKSSSSCWTHGRRGLGSVCHHCEHSVYATLSVGNGRTPHGLCPKQRKELLLGTHTHLLCYTAVLCCVVLLDNLPV